MTVPAVMQSRPGCLSPAVPDSQHAASGAGLSLSQHSLVLHGRDGTGGDSWHHPWGATKGCGAGSETHSKQVLVPVLVPHCLWGALLMGCWRLLWLCHATNKQGRIFQLGLVGGAVAPRCRQPVSLPGSPWSRLPLSWAGASSGTTLASPLPQTFLKPQPHGAVSPGCALRTGFMCFPTSRIQGRCFPTWVQYVAAQSALSSCWS